jgi:hypothetical protein
MTDIQGSLQDTMCHDTSQDAPSRRVEEEESKDGREDDGPYGAEENEVGAGQDATVGGIMLHAITSREPRRNGDLNKAKEDDKASYDYS